MNERNMSFAAPVLIYDNLCYSCTKFAKISRMLSRDRIHIVGHYTQESSRIKSAVFPDGFNANDMFWIVTCKGAFGARSGLLPLISEIVRGMVGKGESVSMEYGNMSESGMLCGIDRCATVPGFLSRLAGLLRNGKKVKCRTAFL